MRNGRCFSLLASLVAVFAFADTSGLASGDSWPANVRVNSGSGRQSPGGDLACRRSARFAASRGALLGGNFLRPAGPGEAGEAPQLGLEQGRRPDLGEQAFRKTASTAAIPPSSPTVRETSISRPSSCRTR